VSDESAPAKPAPDVTQPVGSRLLWGVGVALAIGAVGCLVGLATTDSRDGAEVVYLAGIGAAALSACLIGMLAARRERVLFEAALTATDLRSAVDWYFADERVDREFLRSEIATKLRCVEAYEEAVIAAEAYEQALEMAEERARAMALLRGGEGRG
jgi:hypothetical protein